MLCGKDDRVSTALSHNKPSLLSIQNWNKMCSKCRIWWLWLFYCTPEGFFNFVANESHNYSSSSYKHENFALSCEMTPVFSFKMFMHYFTCSLIPCRANTFKWDITAVCGACCTIIIGRPNVSGTLGPWSSSAVKSLIAKSVWPDPSVPLTVLSWVAQLARWFRRLVSHIVVSAESAGILGGKLCAVWTVMTLGTGCWGDCGTITVFTFKLIWEQDVSLPQHFLPHLLYDKSCNQWTSWHSKWLCAGNRRIWYPIFCTLKCYFHVFRWI